MCPCADEREWPPWLMAQRRDRTPPEPRRSTPETTSVTVFAPCGAHRRTASNQPCALSRERRWSAEHRSKTLTARHCPPSRTDTCCSSARVVPRSGPYRRVHCTHRHVARAAHRVAEGGHGTHRRLVVRPSPVARAGHFSIANVPHAEVLHREPSASEHKIWAKDIDRIAIVRLVGWVKVVGYRFGWPLRNVNRTSNALSTRNSPLGQS